VAKTADISSKRLVSLAPQEWAQWVTSVNNISVIDIIDAQFQWISRDSDVLIKVETPQRGQFLILNEWQLHYDNDIDYRMTAYAALAREKYRIPVYPVLINILQPPAGTFIGSTFNSNFMGLAARQDYRVINLWEVDVETAFSESVAALLPLAPVMKGGNNEKVLRRTVEAIEGEERSEDLLRLLRTFATFVIEVNLVERIMGLEAEALRASPLGAWLKQEGALQMLTRQLRRRFGDVPESLLTALGSLSVEQLEELGDLFIDVNSLDEFIAGVPQTNGN